MEYIKGLEAYRYTGRSAVTFGKFDGLHRGHFKLIDKVKEYSQKDGVKSVVCTFDMFPCRQDKERPKVLMTKEERREHLSGEVDYLVDCPLTDSFRQMEAEDFIRGIIKGLFHAAYVVIGTDFHFGRAKRGDIYMLKAYCGKYDYELVVLEKERYEERIISSTYVRELMSEGRVGTASALLGYHYGLSGIVEHGRKLSRLLGFPTLNVAPAREKVMPPNGVYISRVMVEGVWYPAISNIGVKPTVSEENRILVESCLFGYDGDAYDKKVRIELLEFVRPEQKFASVEELKKCIDCDISYGKQYFTRKSD